MHFHSAIYNCCGQSKKITGLFRCRSVPLIKILQLSSNCNELTYHTHQLLIVIVKAQLPLEKIMILEHITRQGRTQWRTPPCFDLLFLLSQIRPILTAAGLSISGHKPIRYTRELSYTCKYMLISAFKTTGTFVYESYYMSGKLPSSYDWVTVLVAF